MAVTLKVFIIIKTFVSGIRHIPLNHMLCAFIHTHAVSWYTATWVAFFCDSDSSSLSLTESSPKSFAWNWNAHLSNLFGYLLCPAELVLYKAPQSLVWSSSRWLCLASPSIRWDGEGDKCGVYLPAALEAPAQVPNPLGQTNMLASASMGLRSCLSVQNLSVLPETRHKGILVQLMEVPLGVNRVRLYAQVEAFLTLNPW